MSRVWVVVLVSSAAIYAFKAAGPLLLGGRRLPPVVGHLATLLPAALLAALVGVATMADGSSLVVDARLAGLAAAAVALWRRANFVIVILIAAAVTAGVRALGG